MKVFIVTSGQYSDKGNEAVFSTHQKAEEYIQATNQYDSGYGIVNDYIEEFELDPDFSYRKYKFKSFFWVTMEKDGNIIDVNPAYIDRSQLNDKPEIICFQHTHEIKDVVLTGKINADTKQHAVKILNDKRTQLIALNKWVDDLQGNAFIDVDEVLY